MDIDRQDEEQQREGEPANESGLPGGGVGRREEPGRTGVYPMSDAEGASGDAPLQDEMSWGQGKRGAEGYNDSGDSGVLEDTDEQDNTQNSEQ